MSEEVSQKGVNMPDSYRPYQSRLHCSPQQNIFFEENQKNWNSIYAVAYDKIGTMLGSFYPKGENEAPPPESIQELLQGTGLDVRSAYRTILTFVNWFPAERLTDYNKTAALSVDEAINEFSKGWPVNQLGNYSKEVLDAIATFQLREGVSFINRRAKFLNSGLNPNLIQKYFLSPLKFCGAFNTSAELWRQVMSTNFGTSKKGNPAWDSEILTALTDYLNNYQGDVVNPQHVFTHLVDKGVWPDKLDLRGNPAYLRMILGDKDQSGTRTPRNEVRTKAFKASVQERLENIGQKVERQNVKLGDEYRQFFVGAIESLGLFKWENNNELFYGAYTVSWGQIGSHRSNAVRRIAAQTALVMDNRRLLKKVEPEINLLHRFCDDMIKFHAENGKKLDKYSIRENQANGLEAFFKYVKEMPVEDAFDFTAEDLSQRRLRNANRHLLQYLYDACGTEANVPNLLEAVRWHHQNEKICDGSFLGYVSNPLEKPLRPQYGNSKPKGSINFADNEFNATLRLITDSGVIDEKVRLSNKRALEELYSCHPDEEFGVPRNSKHHNPQDLPCRLLGSLEKPALSVYRQRNAQGELNWYVDILPKIRYEQGPRLSKIDNPTILGVDLGWTHPAAFTVITQVGKPPVAHGFLDHKYLVAQEHHRSVFESSGTAPAHILQFYHRLWEQHYKGKETSPVAKPSFANAIKHSANLLKGAISNGVTEETLQQICQLVELVSPYFLSYKPSFRQDVSVSGLGRLNNERLDMMDGLVKLIRRTISKAEEFKFKLDPVFEFMFERITQKTLRLKTERARIVARMILYAAIKHGCNIIAVERLDPKMSSVKTKSTNRGVSRWYARKIIRLLSDESPMHGIAVIEVSARYSSHEDVDGSVVVRCVEINPQTIPEKTEKGKFYSSVSSIENKLKSYLRNDKTPTEQAYQAATADFLDGQTWREVLARAKDAGSTSMLVPQRFGQFVRSNVLGLVKSDVIASQIVAQRGYERWSAIKNPSAARKK